MLTTFFNDPTVTAILVVGSYAAAAGLAWSRAVAAKRAGEIRHERRMLALSLLFLFLALSYQLEFIPEAIALAKAVAKNSGWYDYRWPLAELFLMIFVASAGLLFYHFRPNLRRQPPWLWLMGLGTTALTGYFLLRGTSLHWVDPWWGIHFGCVRTNPWIELASTFCLGLGLWFSPTPRMDPGDGETAMLSSTLHEEDAR